eukprot:6471981-Amphidinium_carterae.2
MIHSNAGTAQTSKSTWRVFADNSQASLVTHPCDFHVFSATPVVVLLRALTHVVREDVESLAACLACYRLSSAKLMTCQQSDFLQTLVPAIYLRFDNMQFN